MSSRAHLRFGSESPRAFSPLLDQSSVAPRTDRPDRSSRDSAQALHRPLEPAQFSRAGRRFRKTADGRRADVCYGRLVLRWGHPLLDYPRSRTPGFRGDRASSSQRTCVSSSPSRSNRPAVFTRSKGSDPHHIERRPKNTPHERPPVRGRLFACQNFDAGLSILSVREPSSGVGHEHDNQSFQVCTAKGVATRGCRSRFRRGHPGGALHTRCHDGNGTGMDRLGSVADEIARRNSAVRLRRSRASTTGFSLRPEQDHARSTTRNDGWLRERRGAIRRTLTPLPAGSKSLPARCRSTSRRTTGRRQKTQR